MSGATRKRVIVWAATAVLLTAGVAQAGGVFFAGTLTDGKFTPGKDADGPCFLVRYSSITAKLAGGSAETTIRETVLGPESGTLRTVCVIPLPESVDCGSVKVTAASGDAEARTLEGKFLTTSEAQDLYEAIARGTGAVSVVSLSGRPALLIEQLDLPPKMELTVSLTQKVPEGQGVLSYACPMPGTAWAKGPVARLSLTATVTADKALRAMFSPSHTAEIERDGLRKASVRMTADHFAARDDFRLCYVADDGDLGLRVLAHRPEEDQDGYFLVVGNPTGSVDDRPVPPKDVLFVLDSSGSMRGEKIEQARAAIEYCLDHLNASDRFSIITFGTEVESFRETPTPNTKANVAAARDFIDDVVARGRTNISGALAKGLAGKPAQGRLRIMIFLTDGTPTAGEVVPDKIVEALPQMNGSKTRIFVMGVGHDVNAHLLDKLASGTEGSSEYVGGDEEIDVKIASLYDRLSNPVLNDVTIAFGELRPTAVFPKELPALFTGSEFMVAGRYSKGGTHTVTVSGTLAGKPVTYTCKAELPARTDGPAAEYVAPLWAARKIGYLLREIRLNGENPELIEEIVRLSTKFGIVTEYTDFIATALPTPGKTSEEHAKKTVAEVTSRLRAARGQQAGQWAVNQAVNEQELQKRVVAADGVNAYRDSRGRMVANDNIRQIGSRVYYKREGGWVDADDAVDRETRKVKLFSEEYFELLRKDDSFRRAQSLGENVEMNVGKERIVVEK